MKLAAVAVLAMLGCATENMTAQGPVHVRVTRKSDPIAGATVLFHDAMGQITARAVTDADGTASGNTETWGLVTVVDPDHLLHFVTVTRLEVGEDLEIPLAPDLDDDPEIGTLTIAQPPMALPAGTEMFDVATPCSRGLFPTLPATLPRTQACTSMTPVLVLARSNATTTEPDRTLAYATTISSPDQTITPQAWSTACVQVDLKTPQAISAEVMPRLGGHAFRAGELPFCQLAPAQTGFTAHAALDFGEGGLLLASELVADSDMRLTTMFVDLPTTPTTYELTPEPLIGEPMLLELSATRARWSVDPALAHVDVTVAEVTWKTRGDDHVVWRFVVPGGASVADVPELPTDVLAAGSLDTARALDVELRHVDASVVQTLQDAHVALPLLLDGPLGSHALAAGASWREYAQTYPQ